MSLVKITYKLFKKTTGTHFKGRFIEQKQYQKSGSLDLEYGLITEQMAWVH